MKFLTIAAIVAPIATSAQTNCASTQDLYSIMRDAYKEERVAQGVSLNGHVTEFWMNPSSGSWTAVITRPDGISCVADQGTDAERITMRGNL